MCGENTKLPYQALLCLLFTLSSSMKHLLRLTLLPLLSGLSSCASLYFPPPPHAPLLTQKGEAYGSISTNQHNNYALQGAYALTDHLGVAGTFSSLHRNKTRKTENLDFAEALQHARGVGLAGLLALDFQQRAERLKAQIGRAHV